MASRNRDRGAAAVEFVLLLPVLMMVLMAIMEFGYAFFIQATVASNAKDAVIAMAKSAVPDPASGTSTSARPTSASRASSPRTPTSAARTASTRWRPTSASPS